MTDAALTAGPTLASDPVVAPAESPPAWPKGFPLIWPAVHGLVSALFVTGLSMAGYPRWRTIAVGALVFGNWLRNVVYKHVMLG
ncbi:MAG TPA: hypothetical protein VLW85_06420, partial [Myxococcales bacterium]|nr:hypothetical protein [Myxococcales bacterium]